MCNCFPTPVHSVMHKSAVSTLGASTLPQQGGTRAQTIPGATPADRFAPGRSNQAGQVLEGRAKGPDEACIPVLQARGFWLRVNNPEL